MKWNYYSCNLKKWRKLLSDAFEMEQPSNKWKQANKLEIEVLKREHWKNTSKCIGPMWMHLVFIL